MDYKPGADKARGAADVESLLQRLIERKDDSGKTAGIEELEAQGCEDEEELVERLSTEPRLAPSKEFRDRVMREIRQRPAPRRPAISRWLALWFWFRNAFK